LYFTQIGLDLEALVPVRHEFVAILRRTAE